MAKHIVTSDNAMKIWDWLKNRGGIAVWYSINLSNPGASWTTPARDADGNPATKPTWEAAETPTIITNPEDVFVSIDREVKRFHVAVRVSSNGLMSKLTDGGTRRVRKEVAKAGDGAFYVFDYFTQEAVIMASDKKLPISEYLESKAA